MRKKDVSLERSLDLLEEGVALANRCTELIDQAAWEVDEQTTDGSQESGELDESDQNENEVARTAHAEKAVDGDEPATDHNDA